MSNIYIQEPPTCGKVLLKTSVGDIDIELWSKETPKACRNFVQLCMEGYYNDTIFHRVVKDFIVQGGDPTGTGEGGESVYGHPFKDEFHTRLRFCRRGLVAMANAGKDDNASQFFFTMGQTQELQNKHTIFGKVTGDTLYNMLKLQEGFIDHNERPQYPHKIIRAIVLENPFHNIEPRVFSADTTKSVKRKKENKAGVKDFKLLSFGAEAEEDEEETERENKKFSGRSKSTHDVLDDPKLSAIPAVPVECLSQDSSDSSDLEEDTITQADKKVQDHILEELNRVKSKLKSNIMSQAKTRASPKVQQKQPDDEQDLEDYTLGQDKRVERLKQTDAIKEEYKKLRRSMKKENSETKESKVSDLNQEMQESAILKEYKKEKEEYEERKKKLPAKGSDRESFTMALLAKFQKKLEKMKEDEESGREENKQSSVPEEDDEADLGKDGGKWMSQKLKFENNEVTLAKDANTKEQRAEDWFEIDDPRNPINQRRRQAAKLSSSKSSRH